jgi:hypothetical protein
MILLNRVKTGYQWLSFGTILSYHSALGCSPFKAMYKSEPNSGALPNLPTNQGIETSDELRDQQTHTDLLRARLAKAKNGMKHYADKNRSERSFQVGDQVLVKLQPHAQASIINRPFPKLAFKYFSPYAVLALDGSLAWICPLARWCTRSSTFHN